MKKEGVRCKKSSAPPSSLSHSIITHTHTTVEELCMTYSSNNDNDYDSTMPGEERDEDYYSWQAEILSLDDLDTEVNESPAKDAEIEEQE
jgi:hypothetical protein